MSDTVLFDRIALIGLGLIGSSLGHALKRDGLVGHIAGTARSASNNRSSSNTDHRRISFPLMNRKTLQDLHPLHNTPEKQEPPHSNYHTHLP